MAVPASETSNFQSWGGNTGLTTNAFYKGQLNAVPSTPAQFSGRQVREAGSIGNNAGDGCYSQMANSPSGVPQGINQVTPTMLSSQWNVQLDGSYGIDANGYGPAVARYYQQYAGTCSMTIDQGMQISTDATGSGNAGWQLYQTNHIAFKVSPSTYSVQRDTNQPASLELKSPWPVQ
jgi:hypothetical protein